MTLPSKVGTQTEYLSCKLILSELSVFCFVFPRLHKSYCQQKVLGLGSLHVG